MKTEFFLLDADYIREKDKTLVRVFGKTERREKVIALFDCEPYFYVLPDNDIGKAEKDINALLKKEEKVKIKRIERVIKEFDGEKREFLKIICRFPQDTQKIRDKIKQLEKKRGGTGSVKEEYEYTINFYRRFLLDKKIDGSCWVEVEGEPLKSEMKADLVLEGKKIRTVEKLKLPSLKLLSFDIETYEEQGKKSIIMLSLWGEGLKKVLTYRKGNFQNWVEVVKDEKELLERFVEIINQVEPDILLSYNGDSFDFPVIQERALENKVKLTLSQDGKEVKFTKRARVSSARIKGRVHIDLFNFINNILSPNLQTETLTLDAVSGELLGDKKIEMDYQELLEAWHKRKELPKLTEYCLKDSELTFKLAYLLLPQILEMSKIVGQLIFDTSRMTYGQLAEWYLTKKAVQMGKIIPNQPKWEQIKKRKTFTYMGGFVKEPLPGLHDNIVVLDFRSLYPSIIATFNISPETLNCSCGSEKSHRVPGKNYWFCKKERGFVSRVIEELIHKRAELKEKMKEKKEEDSPEYRILETRQLSLKIVANAGYGMFAFAGAKWYCRECAESCAAFGRFFIKETIKEAEKEGFTVVYADTDSCFIKKNIPEDKLIKKIEDFLTYINGKLPGIMELELQGIYKRGIFIPRGRAPGTAKKRYALIDRKGNLLIRGLETVRRDWCSLAKRVQREVLTCVLKDKKVEEAIQYVKEVVKKLKRKEIPLKELIIYEQLTKPLSEYRQISPHVVAAQKMLKRGREVSEGMLVMFAITSGKGTISDKAEPIEDITIEDIDENYYIENQIIPAALRVLQVLNVTREEILGESLFS